VEERRSARIGTVSGLALLAGGTAVIAVTEGAHSPFAAVLLGLLTVCLGHSLIVEIRRQAGRRSAGGWARHDTINAVLLGVWAETALIITLVGARPASVRAVGLALALGYAGACGYFVTERRRAVARMRPTATPDPRLPDDAGADHPAPAEISAVREPAEHH
jgi:hypothetical protein